MATAIIILAFITLFVGSVTLIKFPSIASVVYSTMNSLFVYMQQGLGILWFFVPQSLVLTILGLVVSIEVIIRGFKIFLFVYDKLKNG